MMRVIVIISILTVLLPCLAFADAGYALQFDGVDDYVDFGDNYRLQNTDFTIECWIKSTIGSPTNLVVAKHQPGITSGHFLALNFHDYVAFYVGGPSYYYVNSNTDLQDGLWHHLAGVYKLSGRIFLFVDGLIVDSVSASQNIASDNTPFTVGGYGGWFYNGIVDEVRVWDIAKTQEEIQSNMNIALTGTELGLIGYWDFDENSGSTAYDKSTSGINGQFVSSPTWVVSTAPITEPQTLHISTSGNDTTGDGSQQNPFRTIQHGIYMAINGDTVMVWPGTYQEHINFLGKAIVVMSQAGAESTVIEKQFDGVSMIIFENNEDSTSVLDRFTIRNATSTCIICNSSSPIIQNCIIENNTNNFDDQAAGGINIINQAIPVIRNNIIRNNSSLQRGGGIYAYYVSPTSNLRIESNLFYGNISEHGSSIYCVWYSLTLTDNIFYNNISNTPGKGTVCLITNGENTVIENNTIAYNICGSPYGGGIYLQDRIGTDIRNNIISFNDAYGIYSLNSSNIDMNYNCLHNNELGETFGVSPGINDIFDNPYFLNPENYDYSLMANSPCIDAGDPNSPYDPDSTRADMGALYFDQIYRILNFHLIEPANDTIVIGTIQTFTWHSTEDVDSGYVVSYNLIWDDNPIFGSPDSTGIQPDTVYTLSDSLNRSTRYYWRVLASNGHAVPIYSDETWSFYIDGYPSSPEPTAPLNGINADSNTVFTWYVGSDPDTFDAVSYTIQIDDDSLFASPEINQSSLGNTLLEDAFAIQLGQLQGVENLQMDTQYFWRVRSDDNYGLSSPWPDSLLYFTYLHQNHPPNPPDSGFSPANSEEVISLIPVITWNVADDPDPDDEADSLYYAIRLSEDSTFSGFVFNDTTEQGINQIQPSDSLDDNSHYFYQVKTIDDGGLSSPWSTLQNFWTNHYNYPPEPFPLYSPDPDHTRVVMNTEFVWGNTVDLDPMSSFTFKLEYSPDSLFGGSVSSVEALSDTLLTIPTDSLMLAGQDLYWRVLAIDDDSLTRIGGIPEEVRYLRILPPGDANSSGQTNGLDVTYLVSYFKGEGPAPDPLLAGDANGDCATNGLDVIYLVAYFKGGPAPVRPDCGQMLLQNTEVRERGK